MTLAQVVRLFALARSLPEDAYEVHFAAARFDPGIFGSTRFTRWPVASISPETAERAVRWGLPLYTKRILRRYVEDDLRVIAGCKPDLIVGDLRWSLAVSGPRSGVPVASIANACWSPFAVRRFPLPEHPIVRLLGVPLSAKHFSRALPWILRRFARPIDALRKEHALPPLGSLEAVITWGDLTLYADPPNLYRMRPLPGSHRFVGPIHWAPPAGLVPESRSRPLIYVTLGSSGPLRALPSILGATAALDVDVLLATAGRIELPRLPANARAAAFVRGDLAAARASVVICNGGASTAYQALTAGTPVIGLPLNLDQYLVMDAIERAGAGILLRSGTVTEEKVRAAVLRILHDQDLRAGARRMAAGMRLLDAPAEFHRAVIDATRPASVR